MRLFDRPSFGRSRACLVLARVSKPRTSAPGPLYGVFFVKELARAAKLSFVSFLVRSQSPFLGPDLRIADVDASKICTRLAVARNLAACFALAKP
jgi:hypothetical protein